MNTLDHTLVFNFNFISRQRTKISPQGCWHPVANFVLINAPVSQSHCNFVRGRHHSTHHRIHSHSAHSAHHRTHTHTAHHGIHSHSSHSAHHRVHHCTKIPLYLNKIRFP
eukprot:NODE_43_length_33755_cov_1.178542.p37 type:complete len:110 gc:universal NODE_43_length_33755_cov_1.178542:3351-3022(-)